VEVDVGGGGEGGGGEAEIQAMLKADDDSHNSDKLSESEKMRKLSDALMHEEMYPDQDEEE